MENNANYIQAEHLAKTHYENFPVARFVKRELRPAIHAIYAFSRVADDFADEPEYEGNRLQLLQEWRQKLNDCEKGKAEAHIFKQLMPVIHEQKLPAQWLHQLLDAFEYDVKHPRHDNFDSLIQYAQLSANPVGRCVLFLHGYNSEPIYQASDSLCTALQLSNFWQDVGVDAKRGRFYIPQDMLKRHQCTEQQLIQAEFNEGLRCIMQELCAKTHDCYSKARPLAQALKFPLSLEVKLTHLGGQEILHKIERQSFNTLESRPKLNKASFIKLFFKSLCFKF